MARISKFRKELLIGSAGILLTLPGAAWAGTVSGVVSDPSETRGLPSAQVRIVELDRVVTTDRDGSYRFPSPGRHIYARNPLCRRCHRTKQRNRNRYRGHRCQRPGHARCW